jgi:hypothetical protein
MSCALQLFSARLLRDGHDGGASHMAAKTADYFAECGGWWRPRFTPAHASWLNQGGTAQPCLRVPLPEAGVLVQPGGVHRPCGGFVAGVQPALRPPLRVDLDESKDVPMVCRPCSMNFGHYSWPETLGVGRRNVDRIAADRFFGKSAGTLLPSTRIRIFGKVREGRRGCNPKHRVGNGHRL